jgi:hypothetical protein
VTFSADETEPGKLQLKAVNQDGDIILTKGVAEYSTEG